MRKIIYIIGTLAFAIPAITSCSSDFENLNVDPKHPQTLPSKNFFATAQYNLFNQLNTASVNFNIARFFTQQWTETTYTDESNYDMVTRQINTRHWNTLYRSVINPIRLSKEKIAEETTDNVTKNNQLAQLEIMEVYAWANLVDTYNNVPYTDAIAAGDGVLSPKYDDAATIYTDLIKRLNEVSAKITKSGHGFDDYSYGGDMAKWAKLGNSLKLRLGVNLSDVNPTLAKSTVESAIAGGVMTSNDDNFTISFTPGVFSSPLYQTVNVAGSGRKDFVAANTLIDALNAKNDPRRPKFFTTVGGVYKGGTYGASSAFDNFSHVADDIIKENGVADLFDFSEVSFLLAEAAQRNLAAGAAATLYAQGIQASMDYWGVDAAEATAYIAANPYNAANWKKSLGEQTWFAMYNRGFEAWTFNRRLDYPKFVNPVNSVTDGVPTRMTYPANEQSLNQVNWSEAVKGLSGGKDVATAKVFWDKL